MKSTLFKKQNLSLILGFYLLILPLSLSAQESGDVIDKIIAKIDNYIILKSELEARFAELLYSGELKGDEEENKCHLFENLIVQKMMMAKAEIDSVVVEDKEVESNLNRRMEYFVKQFGSPEKIEQQYGKTISDLKNELREQIKEQLIVQKMERTITEDVKITPKEVRKFFESIPQDSIPYLNSEVEIFHIVKIPDVNKEQKRIVREKLEKIRESILAGGDFAEAAKKYSEDPGSAKEGGETGWQARGNFVPAYEATVFKLKPGEISKVIESDYGFHIIKLNERRGNEYNSAHILMRPDYSKVDASYTEKYLDSLRTRILQDSISFEKAAKEYSDDKGSAANGGGISGQAGGKYIAMDELDSYLFFTIDTMTVGTISKPVPFRTDDGKSGIRIIYFKSKTKPHQASLETDYQKIHTIALNNKRNLAINEWFRKTKDQVFISIDKEYRGCKILGIQ